MSRQIIVPARRLSGRIRVPGDKSISHRAAMIASMGEGSCRILGLSSAADVRSTLKAMESLGAVIRYSNPQVEAPKVSTRDFDREILVEGRGLEHLRATDSPIDCQNSGTTARTLLGVLAGRPWETTIDGDASLRGRPMRRVVDPLKRMGADFDSSNDQDSLPLVVRGGKLTGIEFESPIPSAQVKTAVLLAGLQAAGETSVGEPAPSRDHTERLLEYLQVPIHRSASRVVVKSTNLFNAESLNIPGDLSSAAFLLVAAAIVPGSEVTIEDVGVNPTRAGILEVLRAFGAEVRVGDLRTECGEPRGTVTVVAGDRQALSVGGADIPALVDELPLVAVLGALAEGETVIAGAAELRVKESDRIAAMAAGLGRLGATVRILPDGMVVEGPARLTGATVDSAGDHRIAMALAVAGLAAESETVVEGWEAVAVSYPEFLGQMESLVQR